MSNSQFSCCRKLFLAAMRDLPNLIQLDFQASFGTMACFLERKAASRPQPMKFKMTNAVIAADTSIFKAKSSPSPTPFQHPERVYTSPSSPCLLSWLMQTFSRCLPTRAVAFCLQHWEEASWCVLSSYFTYY
jgi:hypothetical protein